jgi:hypothetical protein
MAERISINKIIMTKPLEKITKEYPKRGPLGQFRFDKSFSFNCFRCGQAKTSKLVTIYKNDWSKKLCNGCYGRLLSIYEIKAGQIVIDHKVAQLLEMLIKLVDEHRVKEKMLRLSLQSNQTKYLTPTTMRFFATSECVAETLNKEPNLDWSPAVIGLCKAFELELLEKLINPLRDFCKTVEFSEEDINDKDIGKIASYCSGKTLRPPELGVINHFLRIVVNNNEKLESSNFLNTGFKSFLNKLPDYNWIIDSIGLSKGIQTLTTNFRNRAAHTDELDKNDYENCRNLIFGEKGMMWELILSSINKQNKNR